MEIVTLDLILDKLSPSSFIIIYKVKNRKGVTKFMEKKIAKKKTYRKPAEKKESIKEIKTVTTSDY